MEIEVIHDMLKTPKFSFSKLNSFHGCKYSYKLTYLDGIRGVGNGFSDLGSFVHNILERYLSGEIEQEEMVKVFADEFDENVENGVELKTFSEKSKKVFVKDLTESYKEQCASFLSKFNGFNGQKVVGIEENFNIMVKINDKIMILNGFIDAVVQDENGDITIIDFKSKSKFASKKELKEYARQLYMYSIWIKHKYGKFPKELQFVQFRIDHVEKMEFNVEDYEEMLNWICETSVEIDDEEFFAPSCDKFFANNLCGHSQYCPYADLY